MSPLRRSPSAAWLLLPLLAGFAATRAGAQAPPIPAAIETTLPRSGGQIRALAFDGDLSTYFESAVPVKTSDRFTLRLERPTAVRAVTVFTGRKDGSNVLESGVLEVSGDGQEFHAVGRVNGVVGRARIIEPTVRAIRIRAAENQNHPLAIREIAIDANPPVEVRRYPLEIDVTSEEPALKEWGERTARICEEAYPLINNELGNVDFHPRSLVTMTLENGYNGVAATGGGHIVGSTRYFLRHPDDVGAMVHEATHVAQAYHGRNPGWLVEGVADYVRWYRWEEPGKIGRIDPKTAHYNGAYRITATFLNYLVGKYDRDIVRKLNTAMREGHYSDDLFRQYTGKTVQELDEEWRATLA